MKRFHSWAPLLVLLLLAGCAQTIVPLRYQNLSMSTPSCSSPIVIGQITDERGTPLQIGSTLEQTPFYAESMVDAWFQQALVSQLRSQGCQVLLSGQDQETEALVVHGAIKKAWLNQVSRTEYTGLLQIGLELSRKGHAVHKETFKAEISKRVVPKKTVPQTIMTELLQDLMREVVPTIVKEAGSTQ